ncbi:hypothetical protein ACH4JZ_20755 [Streptomyces sp. NPDC017615]|uniref:hypothetical protein n=1 Tax=Streptomyces sp. NPDC017615 TaxID=3365003 RepID=UPI0037A686EE
MTGTLEGVDPRATYAILVGIEKYENDVYLPTLHESPATDALAHATWLRANGVPAEQIRLCLSVEDARRDSVEAEAAALGIEVRGATQADIWAVLADELPTWKGDLLWLAWSGHGALDPGTGEQYLFYADAVRFREYTLSTENLQDTLLHNPLYAGIPRTVLLVDACRQYLNGFTGAGGIRFPAPAQHSAGSRLMSLYATQNGATASNGRSGRGGAFTGALLAELAAAPAWPPDPQTLIEPVRARLTADRTRQTPYLDARHWNGDRRDWGRTTPRHAAVLTHDQALHRIGRKGRYLSDDHLPYVAPEDPRHPAAPANLLDRLADPPTTEFGEPVRGVLLTAPWGAGKTRTCLETAKLAQEHGWHVLHIAQPEGRTGATRLLVDDLLAEIREDTEEDPERRFLLVFDYLDSQRHLDLRALADALGAEDPDGSRIACLASVRPGALDLVHQRGSQELFEETPLATDDLDQRAVAARIFERVAPRALEAWGHARMARACGTRPVLALLHALAVEKNLEKLLAEGDTAPGDQRLEPTAARSETLLRWLHRRAGEGLTAAADPREERALLLAVTVAALACTQPRDAVETAVDRCLTSTGTDFDDGQSVVNRLIALGWLLPTTDLPDSVELMHDIVAEAFLQQSCLPRAVALHAASLNLLLDTFLGDLPSFRRAVEHIGRWAKELEPDRQRELVRACATWTADRAPALVDMLVTEPQDGMRALTAMVSDTPWRHGVTAAWDTVVTPWMERAGDPALVRTFLTDAVRNTLEPSENLLDCARTWLDAHIATAPDSLALINVLARVPDLPDGHRDDLDRLTLTWLREHGDTPEARDPLVSLLQHDGHSPAVQTAARRTAVALAHRLREDLPSGELLTVLTRTTGADAEDWPVLTESLHDWLRRHTTRERAVSLYAAALRHPRLPASKAEHIAKLGIRWLGSHARKTVAGPLLTVLLDRPGIPAHQVDDATHHAHTWLQDHGTRKRASYVLARLLNHARTGTPVAPARTLAHTLDWLDRYAGSTAADYVLRLVLRVPATATADLSAETVANRTFDHALTWLDHHGAGSIDTQVLVYLLGRMTELSERQLEQATAMALRRLRRPHPPEPSDRHLFQQLLKREPQSLETEELLHRSALAWLDLYGESAEAAYVLPSLTGRARYLERPDDLAVAVERALDWLDLHHTIDTAGRVLRILLMCQGVTTATRTAATVTQQSFEHTLAWYDAQTVPADDPVAARPPAPAPAQHRPARRRTLPRTGRTCRPPRHRLLPRPAPRPRHRGMALRPRRRPQIPAPRTRHRNRTRPHRQEMARPPPRPARPHRHLHPRPPAQQGPRSPRTRRRHPPRQPRLAEALRPHPRGHLPPVPPAQHDGTAPRDPRRRPRPRRDLAACPRHPPRRLLRHRTRPHPPERTRRLRPGRRRPRPALAARQPPDQGEPPARREHLAGPQHRRRPPRRRAPPPRTARARPRLDRSRLRHGEAQRRTRRTPRPGGRPRDHRRRHRRRRRPRGHPRRRPRRYELYAD